MDLDDKIYYKKLGRRIGYIVGGAILATLTIKSCGKIKGQDLKYGNPRLEKKVVKLD